MLNKKYSQKKDSCQITFSISADTVGTGKEVRLLGDFNNWQWSNGTVLKEKDGKYTATVDFKGGEQRQEFRYLVEGNHWFNDAEADDYTVNAFGTHNCVVLIDTVAAAQPAEKSKAASKSTPKAKATSKEKAAPKAKAAPKTKAATKSKAATTPSEDKVATKAKSTAKTKSDDLKMIEGIGPKIATLLHDAGITTFQQLHRADAGQLKAIMDKAGPRFRLHDPQTWQEQAKLAAAGKTDELKRLQDELKGGRRK